MIFKRIKEFFSGEIEIDEKNFEKYWEELELYLLESNFSYEIVEKLREKIKEKIKGKFKKKRILEILSETLKEIISEYLEEGNFFEYLRKKPAVILFFGYNGVGKTTVIAKIAYLLKNKGYKVVVSASDTFRAGSIEQLEKHAEKIGFKLIKQKYGADPAAVAFDAINFAKAHDFDVVLIDTAGRIHTDENLIREMEKIKRVTKPDLTLLVVDATTGNDILNQVENYSKVGFDGYVVTRLDLDEKGGTIPSLLLYLKKPIFFLSDGQGYENLKPFKKTEFLERYEFKRSS